MPAEKVTAWPSAMPTSNTLSGMAFIMMFIEHPVGMAGVTPTMRLLALASSKSVSPNTVWNFGGAPVSSVTMRSSASMSKHPGACHTVGSFSAGA